VPARRATALRANPHGLDLGFLESMRNVNRSALERRIASLTSAASRATTSGWLLRAVSCWT